MGTQKKMAKEKVDGALQIYFFHHYNCIEWTSDGILFKEEVKAKKKNDERKGNGGWWSEEGKWQTEEWTSVRRRGKRPWWMATIYRQMADQRWVILD